MSYLIYINGMGPNYKGDNIYEFIFSDTTEDVWGENWESKPANGYPLPPDAEYIKKWLPELKDIPATKLHRWSEFGEDILKNDKTIKYILPIVNYNDEKEENLKLYGKYK